MYRERRWTIGRTGDIKELLALLLHCSSVPCTVVEREDGHTGDIRCNTGDIKELLALFAIRVM